MDFGIKKNLNSQWELHQILLGHIDSILCIFMNKDEDLMKSGGIRDIKFWKLYDLNWKCEELNWKCEHTIDSYLCFCLTSDASQNNLIFFESNKIKVFEQQKSQFRIDCCPNNQNQRLETLIKLSFINHNQIFLLAKKIKHLWKYTIMKKEKTFQENLIKVQKFGNDHYFSIRIIRQKNIVMVKYGNCVNFFAKNKNQNYELLTKFQFGSRLIYGGLNNDVQFFIADQAQKHWILLLKYQD